MECPLPEVENGRTESLPPKQIGSIDIYRYRYTCKNGYGPGDYIERECNPKTIVVFDDKVRQSNEWSGIDPKCHLNGNVIHF